AVLDRMVFDRHRETLGGRVERRTFRHGPRKQHAVVFEPEIVMEMARKMLLHTEEERARAFLFPCMLFGELGVACGLRRFFEVALLTVFFKDHRDYAYLALGVKRSIGLARISRITPAPIPKDAMTPNSCGSGIDS